MLRMIWGEGEGSMDTKDAEITELLYMIRELVSALEESKSSVRKWAVMPEDLVEDVLTRAQRLLGQRE